MIGRNAYYLIWQLYVNCQSAVPVTVTHLYVTHQSYRNDENLHML